MRRFTRVFVSIICALTVAGAAEAGWRFVTPMPHGRFGHAATLDLDGRIYVMGGANSARTNDGSYSNLVYDPKADKWTYLKPVPGSIMTDYLYILMPESLRWRAVKKKDHPDLIEKARETNVQREGDGLAVVALKDGSILWLGGAGQYLGDGEAIVLAYDPIEGKWPEAYIKRVAYSATAYRNTTKFRSDIPFMLDRRIDHEAVITEDGKIYVFGGRQRERNEDSHGNVTGDKLFVLDTVECYDPQIGRWEYRCPMPNKRMVFAAVLGRDGLIYTFGGGWTPHFEDGTPALYTVDVYDPKTDSWSQRKPMPEPRESHAGVLGADGKIYILGGGRAHSAPPLRDVLIYDPVKDSWKKGPPMNTPRAVLAAVATPEGKIYAIGGSDVGAYKVKETLNSLIPTERGPFYTGKVLNTVEVLNLSQ
jgi:N-acetylneuraminic acid mutarotase